MAPDSMHLWPAHSELSKKRIALVPPGGDKRDLMMRAPELCPPSWFRLACQATDVFGRIISDAPANTIRCEFQNPSKGRYIHPTENRTLSLREGARLQDVPDEWHFTGGPGSIARQIGNGVPLKLGSAIGGAISTLF
jgi:DNA (cytosine-5)-methyltransferase 1